MPTKEEEREIRKKRASYNREYYLKNKDRIAKRKSNRYHGDPEYQQQIKDGRRRQLDREKEERKRKSAARVPLRKRPGKRTRLEFPDGTSQVVEMLSVGQAAHKITISHTTLRSWETRGIVPPCMYKTDGGNRMYTIHQVEVITKVFKRFYARVGAWRVTDEFINTMWDELEALHYGVRIEDGDDETSGGKSVGKDYI
jgi:hypothetical protein